MMISKKDEKILRKMLSLATEPDEAMTYNEMCGFLFGVAITPDVVVPSEWLPLIFGEELITIDSEQEGQRLLNTLMHVVNDLVSHFQHDAIRFPFDIENLEHEDDIIPIHEWVYGLDEALTLRPACWFDSWPESIPKEFEEELMTALSVIHGIAESDEADEMFDTEFDEAEDRSERLMASLFMILPSAIESLLDHAYALEKERQERLSQRSGPLQKRRGSPKVGRNDPCTCGSGKKYKKCCMVKDKVVPIH